jgi:hypothetical protein
MLKWTLAAVAAVIVVFLIVVALQPSDFKVERSATMRAPAPAAFAQVNDFQNWQAWSPWEKVDPALKRQFEGPKAGAGAVYAWQGNKDVGEGRMTIMESRPGELVRIKLEFSQAVRGDQYRGVQLQARGRRDHRRHLEHGWAEQLPVEGDLPVRRHGPDGRRHV